jgi:hypothetical protein
MSAKSPKIPLARGARLVGASYSAVFRCAAELGALERDEDGRLVISEALANAMSRWRSRTGYLRPRRATLVDILPAANAESDRVRKRNGGKPETKKTTGATVPPSAGAE